MNGIQLVQDKGYDRKCFHLTAIQKPKKKELTEFQQWFNSLNGILLL